MVLLAICSVLRFYVEFFTRVFGSGTNPIAFVIGLKFWLYSQIAIVMHLLQAGIIFLSHSHLPFSLVCLLVSSDTWHNWLLLWLQVKQPILFLSGLQDEMVPPVHMQMLYAKAATHNKRCIFVEFPNGMHMDTWLSGGDRYWRTIQLFLGQHVPETDDDSSYKSNGKFRTSFLHECCDLLSLITFPKLQRKKTHTHTHTRILTAWEMLNLDIDKAWSREQDWQIL